MKHLLEVIAKALVDQPDKVTVTEKETADAVVLEPVSYTHLTLPTIA